MIIWWKQHGTKVLGSLLGLFGLIETLSPGDITSFLTSLFGDRGPGIAVSVLGWLTFIRGFINQKNLSALVSGGTAAPSGEAWKTGDVVTRDPALPPTPPAQKGFTRLTMLALLAPLAFLVGCAWLGLQSVKSLDEGLAEANVQVTAAAQATHQAYTTHQITESAAQSVDTILHQAIPLLDAARAAEQAGDTAGAQRNLVLVQSLLAGLQTYLTPKGGTTP